MIKHIIASTAIIVSVWTSVYMFNLDKEVNKIANIKTLIKTTEIKVQLRSVPKKIVSTEAQENKKIDAQIDEKLKALKDKAGNIAPFEVSTLYKKNCSSCHGVIGYGIIGPKLIGMKAETILKDLHDFKSGARKNYVMYGLLGNLNDEQISKLAKEIGSFQTKLEASTK